MDRNALRSTALLTLLLIAVWVVAAWLRPTATYHVAPLLVAAALPLGYVLNQRAASLGSVVALTATGEAVALLTTFALAAVDKLEGPSLLPFGGAVFESVLGAALGASAALLVGLVMVRRTT